MSSADSESLGADQTFEILSSQRRRMVLYYLRKHDGVASVNDLAEQIAAWENDISVDDITSQQRKRVYVSLYQTHLPKLADASLIDYNVDEAVVRLTDRATEMDAFLSPKEGSNFSWQRHYPRLLILGGLLIALALLLVPVVGETLLAIVATVVVTGYLVMLGIEYWFYRKRKSEVPPELLPRDQ